MYRFRRTNKTTLVWEDLEVVEIRLTNENFYILVVVNPNNNLEFTKLNTLLANSLEEAMEEATARLREYSRKALLSYY